MRVWKCRKTSETHAKWTSNNFRAKTNIVNASEQNNFLMNEYSIDIFS